MFKTEDRAVDVFLVLGPDFGLGTSGGAPSVGRTVLGLQAEAGETPQEVWGLGWASLLGAWNHYFNIKKRFVLALAAHILKSI